MTAKLLFVVNVPWFFISHRLPIALAAKSAGYDVHVATSAGPEVAQIRSKGLTVHEIPFTRSSSEILHELRTLYGLYMLYKKIQPDIVHHVTIKPVLYGSFIAGIVKVPNVVNAISGLGFVFIAEGLRAKLRRLLVKTAYRYVLRKKNVKVIFQNPDDQSMFINMGILNKEQAVLIKGSGVDTNLYFVQPELDGPPVVVLIARMLWDKGIKEFVEAARHLKKRGIEARFLLVGDIDKGNPKSISYQEIDLGCKENVVEWSGYSADIPKIMASSHIVCLPSYREGLPKVLIEAAACGRAVVTTDVPGCRDAIEPDVSGLLVRVHDIKSLADALERLITDDSLRRKMGRAGRVLAEREFTIQKVVDAHMAIYKDLVSI
ncbi:Lipid carrier : UDP-N-acetylgalactosaminyltransferase / Alpha-1,3-N-acetylgalactosamine transferase PglA; Putative glycosyltransferase [hydrothermal vent metagenome]|uniref:Lipid carrier: UDP-N-acetylgalactosaminyltransferase / Alpha-1,3-N-acetylgalactosamine transferase PglA Putative glycosyltransferase n=1 Tax=hydrothermal vent metagenome TaxID=652676 RepID=A0A3B1BLX9_9ZZZZ